MGCDSDFCDGILICESYSAILNLICEWDSKMGDQIEIVTCDGIEPHQIQIVTCDGIEPDGSESLLPEYDSDLCDGRQVCDGILNLICLICDIKPDL